MYPEDKDLIEQVRRRRNRRTKPAAMSVAATLQTQASESIIDQPMAVPPRYVESPADPVAEALELCSLALARDAQQRYFALEATLPYMVNSTPEKV